MKLTSHLARALPAATLLLAACGRQPAPVVAPAPVVIVAPTPATAPAAGAPPATGDSAARRAAPDVTPGEVTRQALGVFGDSVLRDSAAAGEGDEEGPTWDIDVRSYETHERVERFVRMFSGSAREHIQDRLAVGTRYEPMIRAKFRAAGVPEDMYYLALIESGFDNHAYSRAAAVGMWQFMASTARGLGMRVDWWIDERRDPVKSTDGAIRFLGWLREQLGSYYLAAAAYNGGPGRVARGLTRYASDLEGQSGDDAFFTLADKDFLPKETVNYVPQLIAAALVGKDPARYGLTIEPRPAFAYDSVRTGAATPLAAVAHALRVPLADVVELNPHVLRGVTPPAGGGMWVRVPVGKAAGFDSAYRALDPDERKAFTRVETKKGQTVASIARAHDLSARQLAWYNRSLTTRKNGTLHPGQIVLVPSAAVVSAARDVPDPAVERYGSTRTPKVTYHVVKRGESLGRIANRYGTSVRALKSLNHLRKDMVFPGQTLVVKGTPARAGRSSGTRSASGSSSRKGKATAKSSAKRSTAKSSSKRSTAKASSTRKKPAASTKKAAASSGSKKKKG